MTSQPAQRKKKPQTVLEVLKNERLNDWTVRLTLGGENFAKFPPVVHADSYVKLVFVKPELGLTAPYDLPTLRSELAPEDRPVTRTYTVRSVDQAAGTITIDFVLHGDEGIAAPWAAAAQPGDQVVMLGPGGAYSPDSQADAHLLVGDASALPAIAAALERMPEDAKGIAILAVDHEQECQKLVGPAGIEVVWHVEPGTGADPERFSALVAAHPWPEGRVQVFAHGEREGIKQLRRLFKQHEVPREDLSISGYWAYGRTEDVFQAEKRTPIGKIDVD